MMDFFISYNRADRSWAEWIAWQLEDAGYTVVVQAWDFRPGENFALQMQNAVAMAERTIAVLSPDYSNALYTQSEWAAAFAKDPTGEKSLLIPVRVREVESKGLLRTIAYVDLVGLSEAEAKMALLTGVNRGRAKPSHIPTFPGDAPQPLPPKPVFPRNLEGIEIFSIYSDKDEELWKELQLHLRILIRQGIITESNSKRISTGDTQAEGIDRHINTANIILLLISSDFIALDYVFSEEIKRAIERHQTGDAYVIPVILRPVVWNSAPFGNLQALPRNAKPVTSWADRDEAFSNITKGILLACQEIQNNLPSFPAVITQDGYKLVDVFKPSGVPNVTFVEPENFYLLKLAMQHPGRGVVIEGPSGIGKTTALKKAIDQIQSDGQLNKIRILSARKSDDVQSIKDIERWHNGPVAIDDFHRLEESLRQKLVDYLKYLADAEIVEKKLVIVGIPGTGKDLVEIAFDVATRMDIIRLGRVDDEIILSMIEKGENALNIRFDRKTDIVRAAGGSLNIAQILCSHMAARAGIGETQRETKSIHSDVEAATSKVMEQMSLKFGEVIRSFAAMGGPEDRTCIELLFELMSTDDGRLSLFHLRDKRPDLSAGINRFISEDLHGGFIQ